VVSYARVCRERGETVGDISRRLGLVESTLARWLRAERKDLQAGFLPVSIVAAEAAELGETGAPLRLITPRGYCVEGLDAQTLALLLRVVG
jgi:transposase-like protein